MEQEPYGRFENINGVNLEEGKKFFKIKLLNKFGYHEPCFVCRADSEEEALDKFRLTQPQEERGKFKDIEEISSQRYKDIRRSEVGQDKVDN